MGGRPDKLKGRLFPAVNVRRLARLGALLVLVATPAAAQLAGRAAGPTRVLDREALHRLEGNDGVSLQWIERPLRGRLTVTEPGGRVHLDGEQREVGGPGDLRIVGDVE